MSRWGVGTILMVKPFAGVEHIVTFFEFGTNTQTFLVPAGVTSLTMDIIGGPGGGTNISSGGIQHFGGFGSRVTGKLAVVPGETLSIQVAGAGRGASGPAGSGTGVGGWPDGGSSTGPANNHGGGGGGSTRIWRGGVGGTLLAQIAGGGGTGGYQSGSFVRAGDGGDNIGFAMDGQLADPVGSATPGHGAAPGSGGAAGGGSASGTPGGPSAGGAGAPGVGTGLTTAQRGGGAGGGGRYGGGGGGRTTPGAGHGAGGGGGSSYLGPGWTVVVWTVWNLAAIAQPSAFARIRYFT